MGGVLVAGPAAAAPEALAEGAASPETVTADALPTVQIDGVVWAQQAVGNRVYVGGDFANARPAGSPAGSNQTPRQNALAYNLQTGVLDTSWNPSPNARILSMAVSPNGQRLYVAGQFTNIAGQTRYRIAAFNAQTGELINNWVPVVNTQVVGVAATDSTVYIVGNFSSVNGVARPQAAALSAATGALITQFDPILQGGNGARAVVISPDESKVVIAGSFVSTNGSTGNAQGRGMVALDVTNGDMVDWKVANVLHNAGDRAAMYSLASDGDSVYGTGYDFGGTGVDGFEGSFRADWSDGTMRWMEDCHGDTYSAYPFKGALYVAGHAHYCGNIGEFPQMDPWYFNHSLAFSKEPSGTTITPDIYGYRSFTGNPAGKLLHWYPRWTPGTYTGANQAGWNVTASGNYLLYGGEFTTVSGVGQQGLVRFAMSDIAPNAMGPSVRGGNYKITAGSFMAGMARIAWPANFDPDDAQSTYELLRQGVAAPLYTTTAKSTYWVRPTMTYVDTSVNAGQTYNYRVRVTDPHGNTTLSDWTPVTIAAAGSATPYNLALLESGAVNYWPMNEPSGSGAIDWMSGNDIALSDGGITRGKTGPSGAAATGFSGATGVFGASANPVAGPQVFSVEAWFRTTSTSGGKILGFGNAKTGQSSSYDRHLYLSNAGRVTFGVYPGATRTLSTGTGYNDGQWHYVVGTLGPNGMTLYIDGLRSGFRGDTTSAQGYSGYWRVGGDNQGGWSETGNSSYLNGDISDVAVYDSVLTREQVNSHWIAAGRNSALPLPPTDLYGQSVFNLQPNIYWRFGEPSGTTAVDSGTDMSNGTYQGNAVQLNQAGALKNVSNSAVSFNMVGNNSFVSSNNSYSNPTTYTLETWFKTTSTGGGNIVGFGISRTGTSSNHDRHIYMSADGRVKFGVWTGTQMVVQSNPGYNDGNWHHVVAAQSATGQKLYLDGLLVDSNSNPDAENYTGYWRVGGDTPWEGSTWWQGTVDEFAVYGQALTPEQVQDHYSLGKDGKVNVRPTAGFTFVTTDLAVAFDASTLSSDPDGTIEQYAWDFGDGTTDTTSGATVTHTYSGSGTHTVTLTVTDDNGATGTFSTPVSVLAPNLPPTASFVMNTDENPTIHLDASSSTDSDGTIDSYNWDFGDGQVGTGQTISHTYAQTGDYTITLTVTDNRSGTAVATEQMSVSVPNTPPVADFSSTVAGLSVSYVATASDANNDELSYVWDFGDGHTDATSGALVTHDYQVAEATTFSVSLTVSDGQDSVVVTHGVTVAPPPTEDVIAQDLFERTLSNTWGVADMGGVWTLSGGNPAFSVAGGSGVMTLAKGATRNAVLNSVSGTEAVVSVKLASDLVAAGASTSVTVIGRQVGSALYGGRIRFEAGGPTRLMLMRITSSETALGSFLLPGTYTPGRVINLQLSVTGVSPTTIMGKAWYQGDPEPANWQQVATDSTAGLQAAGTVGIRSSVSSSSTLPITVLTFDDFKVTTGLPPAVNHAPTASFKVDVNGLKVDFDARDSADADGDPLTYAWNFGDGSSGTGATVSHTYTANTATTFQATLTVSDGKDTASVTHAVNVAPPPNTAPVAAFVWTADGLQVAFDASGSSDADGDDLTYAWQFGDNSEGSGRTTTHTYGTAGTHEVTLTVSDGKSSNSVTREIVVDELPPSPTDEVVAEDTFTRNAVGSWGVADKGGLWTLSGGNPAFSIADGRGQMSLAKGATRASRLMGVMGTRTVTEVQITADSVPEVGTNSVTVIGRQVGSAQYGARIRFEVGGIARLMLMRISGTEASLASVALPGTYTAGDIINVKVSVTGTSPTMIAAKAWREGDLEPTAWTREAMDVDPALQAAGYVAIQSSVSSSNPATATLFTFDNYKVTRLG